MWKPLKYPGPCFDFHFDRFDGFIFEAEKPSKTCAPQGPPQYSCGSIFFYICSIASHRTWLSLSMNLEWQRSRKRNSDHFFGVENSKKE